MSEEQETKPYRTKVTIGVGSVFGATQQFTMAYEPVTDGDGDIQVDNNGNVLKLKRLGGVKVGSAGEIAGKYLKAPKSMLVEYEKSPGTFGLELVEMIPVDLTEYKKMAWFPQYVVRVVG